LKPSPPNSLLTTRPPVFSAEEAQSLALQNYSLDVSAKPLDSERDQNFHLLAENGAQYVLKISNANEHPSVIDFQTRAFEHIAQCDPNLPVPRTIASVAGSDDCRVTDSNGIAHVVRILSWLEGVPIRKVSISPALLNELGNTLARLGKALRGFFHPAAGHELLWDLKNAAGLIDLLPHVEDKKLRAQLENVLIRYRDEIQPRLGSLRAQVIHCDLNPDNVLTGKDDTERVTGIIDFGDMVHTALINDLAIAAAYHLSPSDDCLSAALEFIRGYHSVTPLERGEAEILYDLMLTRLVSSVVICMWRAKIFPENRDYLLGDKAFARDTLMRLSSLDAQAQQRRILTLCGHDAMGSKAGKKGFGDIDSAALIQRREKLMGKAYRLFYDRPLHLVRGEGVWLFDAQGKRYLDVYNNVPHVGHCHPHVVDAIYRQAQTLNTHTRYLHQVILDYSERLLARFPGSLDIAMFACTGTEANELALRIARSVSGGNGMIVTGNAYHGNSWAISQISPEDEPASRREANVVTVPAPDTWRGDFRGDEQGAADYFANHVSAAIETLQSRGIKPAAFIVDTIFASEGVICAPAGYLLRVAELIRQAGGVFIADEVQPGFGRMGSNFWGFEAHGVIPDIVTMGKPMGNGHPVSALVTSFEAVDSFSKQSSYFNTFGGNPVSCAAAMAVMDVIEAENLQANALEVGKYLHQGLESMSRRHEIIGDIRGSGFFIGVDLVQDRHSRKPAGDEAVRIINDLKDRGVLAGRTGPHGNVLKFRPPMVFSKAHADLLLERFEETLRRNSYSIPHKQ